MNPKGSPVGETNQSTIRKATTLNPNAAAFIPSSLKGVSPGATSSSGTTLKFSRLGTPGEKVFERSESSISAHSDEEARQYWQRQLPDDITLDFDAMGGDNSEVIGGLSLAGLSLHDGHEANRFSSAVDNGYLHSKQLEISPRHGNGTAAAANLRHPSSSFGEDLSPSSYLHTHSKPLDQQGGRNDLLRGNENLEVCLGHGYASNLDGELPAVENSGMNPLEFLASHFPGFAADSLAEVYFANYCDLQLTMEMFIQLELQVDGGLSPTPSPKSKSAPISGLDFAALSPNKASLSNAGDDAPNNANPFRSSEKENFLMFKSSPSLPSVGSIDFASAARKQASKDSYLWKYDRNGSADGVVSSSRTPNLVTGSYNSGPTRDVFGDSSQICSAAQAAPVWLETSEAVATIYSELREEARDHARIRNAYFEQARQAYLIGNKALAKELSAKGQLHNMQMKAAHNKAQESMYRQRNPVIQESHGRGQEKMIDLHGLLVNEAIHVLKHEFAALRSTARSSALHLPVYICVGTGHHTRGSRTPASLPIALQRYLLEEEGLDYSEPHPGLLRVIIY
ncbi:Polyadenylate-binding protein-interacting protein 7-like protein [Drosera capensis]